MNNQNSAKKIIEVDLSNKWPVGSVIVAKSMTGRYRSSALVLSYLGNDTVSVSHASGRPTTMQTKTMQAKYRLATEAEASIFRDAAIGPDKDSAMGESKDAVPRGPRKVESAPAVEPEPQPTPAPAAPVSDASMAKVDTSVIEMILKRNAEDRSALERRFDNLITSLPGLMREAAVAAVGAMAAPALAPAPTPPTKEQVKRGENAKVIKAELPWARPLVTEFIAAELERVTFNTAAEIERAMFPGDVQQALELWCLAQGKQAPDDRTTNVILKEIAPERRFVSDGKVRSDDKQKTQFARRRQTTLDFEPSANDVDRVANDVLAHGRKVLWPSLPATDPSTIKVAGLLKDGKVTKAELIAAINGARIEFDRQPNESARRHITPATVFADAARVRYLGKTFRDLGGGK